MSWTVENSTQEVVVSKLYDIDEARTKLENLTKDFNGVASVVIAYDNVSDPILVVNLNEEAYIDRKKIELPRKIDGFKVQKQLAIEIDFL
jgi:hypothetical protein